MRLVIDISEEDYEKIKTTSFVENTETVLKQSSEDRKGTMMLFRIMDSIKNGEPQNRVKCKSVKEWFENRIQLTDAVSKQAVIAIMRRYAFSETRKAFVEFLADEIDKLPPATPMMPPKDEGENR